MNEPGGTLSLTNCAGGIDLVRKGAHGHRDGGALDVEKPFFAVAL
jgi:hypothetical protein